MLFKCVFKFIYLLAIVMYFIVFRIYSIQNLELTWIFYINLLWTDKQEINAGTNFIYEYWMCSVHGVIG